MDLSSKVSDSCSDMLTQQPHVARPPSISLGTNVEIQTFLQNAIFRMEVLHAWPDYLPVKEDDIVKAAFEYKGVGEGVRCYFCCGLKNWKQDDEPIEEHAKWYPKCPLVRLVKGQEYVEKLSRGKYPVVDVSSLPTDTAVAGPNHLESIAAQICVEMGFPAEMAKKAVDVYIERYGIYSVRAEYLVIILYEIEDESACGSDANTCIKSEDGRCLLSYVGEHTTFQEWTMKDKYKRSSGSSDVGDHTSYQEWTMKDKTKRSSGSSDVGDHNTYQERTTKGRNKWSSDSSDVGRHTKYQNLEWVVKGKTKRSSGSSGWAISLIKKLMNLLDDTLKTATDIMSLLVKKCPQLFPDLTREPTEQDLVTFAEAIGDNFQFLGLALGLSDAKLDQISLDHPTTVLKSYNMLREWVGKNPLQSTVSSLIQTMKSCRSVKIDWNQIGKVCMSS